MSPVQNASSEIIVRGISLLKSGNPVSFATDTVYAMGAPVNDDPCVAKVFEIKQRPLNMALPILLSSADEIRTVASEIPEVAEILMRRFWPGALTLVLKKTALVSDIVTAGGPTVAVRVADHPVAIEIVRRAGVPLVGTSANIHGQPSPVTARDVAAQIGDHVQLIIDSGRAPGGVESTIIDLSSNRIRILRQGAVSRAELEKYCKIEKG